MIQNRALGIVFSNTFDYTLPEMTANRAIGSVPFGGKYRFIDFPLSMMANCGVREILILTKTNYNSLMDHVGVGLPWDLVGKNMGIRIIPPFIYTGRGMYQGKLDGLKSARGLMEASMSELVVLSDSNLFANIDLSAAVEYHFAKYSELTALYIEKKNNNSEKIPLLSLKTDKEGRVKSFKEHNVNAGDKLCLNIFIVNKKTLLNILDDAERAGYVDFNRDFLECRYQDFLMYGYEYKGFSRQIYSLKGYFEANMELLGDEARNLFCNPDMPIQTKVRDDAPVTYGLDCEVENSLLSEGCIIEGKVENSILSKGVRIKKGAVVKNSILMQDTEVGEGAVLEYVIADKNVRFEDKTAAKSDRSAPEYFEKGRVI